MEKETEFTNQSILDQIIKNQKAEEVANFNVVKIIDELFSELSSREKDVLIRRFGLHGQGKETLENIGSVHQLTRERIRQIETSGVKRLASLKNLENYLSSLKKVIFQLLEEHGGFMEKEYLIDNLVKVSSFSSPRETEGGEERHRNYLEFLISRLLYPEFRETANSKYLKSLFKLKYQDLEHVENLCDELEEKLKKLKKTLTTLELIELIKNELETYRQHEEKLLFRGDGVIDVSPVLKKTHFSENPELINSHKPIYSILQAAKRIEQNKFGYWGHESWREIKPKTINDKVYLVLKSAAKPMHFAEIADRINEVNFDHKQANAATVHNELILDKKYILIGRGIYALKEWGYNQGTVSDVIVDILANTDKPLPRDEIIERVLQQRDVKRATIVLALMNKEKFERNNGKYSLKVQ